MSADASESKGVNCAGFAGGPTFWKDGVHRDEETDEAVSSTAARALLAASLQNADCAPYRAARRLKTTDRVIAALIADGPGGPILPGRPPPNNRSASARVIPRDALDAFERDCVSLMNLARERGAHHVALAVAPQFDGAGSRLCATSRFRPVVVCGRHAQAVPGREARGIPPGSLAPFRPVEAFGRATEERPFVRTRFDDRIADQAAVTSTTGRVSCSRPPRAENNRAAAG